MLKKKQIFAFLISILIGPILNAADRGLKFPSTIFRVQQHSFSGQKNKSFSEALPSYSGGVAVLMQREYFAPYLGFNFGGQSGKQTFLDGDTEFTSGYNYQYGSAEAGIYFFPLGRMGKGLNIYVNGAGLVGYQSINLKTTATLTKLTSKTEQAFSTGYKGNVGFEWILTNRGNQAKWTIYSEVGFKKESTQLLKQTFLLDSLSYTIGLGW